jgi:IMP dehydrogenase
MREGVGKQSREEELVEEVIQESVPEGVEGLIAYKGKVAEVVKELVGGLRSGMSYCGAKTVVDLQRKAEFIRITSAGYKESLPHDIERVI